MTSDVCTWHGGKDEGKRHDQWIVFGNGDMAVGSD